MTFFHFLRKRLNCLFMYTFSYLHLPFLFFTFSYDEWRAKILTSLMHFSLNFTLYLTNMSDRAVGTCAQFCVFLPKNCSKLSPLAHTRTSHGVSDMNLIFMLDSNVGHSYQDVTDQVVAVLYFCSINFFFDTSPWEKSSWLRSRGWGGQKIGPPWPTHMFGKWLFN
jgi:hypothetical protein